MGGDEAGEGALLRILTSPKVRFTVLVVLLAAAAVVVLAVGAPR